MFHQLRNFAIRAGFHYDYDGPRQPNGDFLENLKITENLRFCDFSDHAEIYGKITEKLLKTTEIKQQIRKKYKIRRFPVFFRNFLLQRTLIDQKVWML